MKKIKICIIRPSVDRKDKYVVIELKELLESGYKIIDKTACEDRIVYILEISSQE